MRKFKNLKNERQIELTRQFPDLLKLSCAEETFEYTYLAVSVFDHWLGREKSVKFLDNVPGDEQSRRNNILYSFSKKLAQNTEVINFKFRGRWNRSYPLFRGFTSIGALEKYLEPAISHPKKNFFRIILPELGAVFFESWDDTNVFYLRDSSKINLIREWAIECGMFCIEK